MAKISDIIFCLNATNVEGEGASADRILTALRPEYIPGLFSFSVVVTVLDLDPKLEHPFLILFTDPYGTEIVKAEGTFHTREDASNLPAKYKGVNMVMNLGNVNFKVSGEYKMEISIDGNLIQEKLIYVKGQNE